MCFYTIYSNCMKKRIIPTVYGEPQVVDDACTICQSPEVIFDMKYLNCEHMLCNKCTIKIKEFYKEFDCVFCKNKYLNHQKQNQPENQTQN